MAEGHEAETIAQVCTQCRTGCVFPLSWGFRKGWMGARWGAQEKVPELRPLPLQPLGWFDAGQGGRVQKESPAWSPLLPRDT